MIHVGSALVVAVDKAVVFHFSPIRGRSSTDHSETTMSLIHVGQMLSRGQISASLPIPSLVWLLDCWMKGGYIDLEHDQ